MLRDQSLEEISDGKRYNINDMVRADAGGCKGCSKCCETMTDTIVLNPCDIYNIQLATKMNFDKLLNDFVEINIVDGLMLPNIKNTGSGCPFLSSDKRCNIHGNRPDICRLFPLGRLYENDGYTYILQKDECEKATAKVKVKKWIGIANYSEYSRFILEWHIIIVNLREAIKEMNDEIKKQVILKFLSIFYLEAYDQREFYVQFDERKAKWENLFLGM